MRDVRNNLLQQQVKRLGFTFYHKCPECLLDKPYHYRIRTEGTETLEIVCKDCGPIRTFSRPVDPLAQTDWDIILS